MVVRSVCTTSNCFFAILPSSIFEVALGEVLNLNLLQYTTSTQIRILHKTSKHIVIVRQCPQAVGP